MTELSNINWKQTDEGKWLAYDDNRNQITGWVHHSTEDRWYYCYSDDIARGWVKDTDDRWYYFSPNQQCTYNHQYYTGEMMINWIKIENKWYYLVPKSMPSDGIYKGQCLIDTEEEINGENYIFDKNGVWIEKGDGLVSNDCINFIKSYEGYFATPYYDCVGVKTLGYGMTGSEIEGLKYVTENQATNMLKDWIDKKYAPPIKKALDNNGITLKQNEFDALVSMAYNVGYVGVIGSTLFKNICNGVKDVNTITSNFTAWSKAGGKTITGLLRRRQAEAKIFLYGIYENN